VMCGIDDQLHLAVGESGLQCAHHRDRFVVVGMNAVHDLKAWPILLFTERCKRGLQQRFRAMKWFEYGNRRGTSRLVAHSPCECNDGYPTSHNLTRAYGGQ
jgi:hypothetical protein